MKHSVALCFSTLIFIALACSQRAQAAVKMPALFGDHMVLQQDTKLPVWGWADAGENITVSIGGREARASADAQGKWKVSLDPLPVSGKPLQMTIKGSNTLVFNDVLVGEVWLAGGQSNMAYRIQDVNTPKETLEAAKQEAAAAQPFLRYFSVVEGGADEPQDDVKGNWVVATPDNVGKCSAVAWYFGVALQNKLERPVGLIFSTVGGTPAEAWIPKPELDATSVADAIWKRHKEKLAQFTPELLAKHKADLAAWSAANSTPQLRAANGTSRPKDPYGPTHRAAPVRLYNGMIHGLEPYAAKGVIWFQADGNCGFPAEYPELIKTLIQSWRAHWETELPFYYVEMNNMWDLQKQPVGTIGHDPNMALIREAQAAALELPKTGVVAAIDLGDSSSVTNPHFPNKKPVGDRLAHLALSETYGLPMGEVDSPQFDGYTIEGGKIRLRFKFAEGLRIRDGGALKGFAIQGAGGDWVWAEGKMDGKEIVVWNSQVPQPKAVRYAWASNPVISVENGAGLPLRPFRTDTQNPK